MELRDYQIKCLADIYAAWERGSRNVLLRLDTGAGKTIIFSEIISKHSGYSIAIAHRGELVSQISIALARAGVRHALVASKSAIRGIIALHMYELNTNFIDPSACCIVASVDTLINRNEPWFKKISLVVQDEAHHVLVKNKWGKAASLFPNARGLYPTATPQRADGRGLGRNADGVIDTIIYGPPMRLLIDRGYLTDYVIFAPKPAIDFSTVPVAASGDFNPAKLRTAVHESKITGDIVKHYLKIAPGKLGVTFAVDVKAAEEIVLEFKKNNVPAEMITAKTPDLLRASIMRRFRNREILQIINVDLLGEGVDVPAIEVVSMARPTQSYALYAQQFGRALRPMPGKTHAIIIDHVENYLRHGLPDSPRRWSLNRRETRAKSGVDVTIQIRSCLNPECLRVYERVYKNCPYCGYVPVVASRSTIDQVDGDLYQLDPQVLSKIRGEIKRIDSPPRIGEHHDAIVRRAIEKRHCERQNAQLKLRDCIAVWAGYQRAHGLDDATIYRKFYLTFNIDIASAMTLKITLANELGENIQRTIESYCRPQ